MAENEEPDYFAQDPSFWSLKTFLEHTKKQMGSTMFHAVDFRARKNDYVNRVLVKRKLWYATNRPSLARVAESVLPKPREVFSLQAEYDVERRTVKHEKLAMPYIDQTVSNALGTLTNAAKRKASEVSPDETRDGKVQKAKDDKSNKDNDSDLKAKDEEVNVWGANGGKPIRVEAIDGEAIDGQTNDLDLPAGIHNVDVVKKNDQTGLNLALPASIPGDLVSQAVDKIVRAIIDSSVNSGVVLNIAKEAASAAKEAANAATAAAAATNISCQLSEQNKELQIELGRYNKRQVYELAVKKKADERHAAARATYHAQVHDWEVGGRQWVRPMPPIPSSDRPNYSNEMRTMWSGNDVQLMQETAAQLAGYEAGAVQSVKETMATAYGDASKDIAHSYRPREIPSLSFTSHLEEAGMRAMGRRFNIPPYS